MLRCRLTGGASSTSAYPTPALLDCRASCKTLADVLSYPVCPSPRCSSRLTVSPLAPQSSTRSSVPRRRVKTLQKPAHTPEESVYATGQSKPDNAQRGSETIQKWSASHSTEVKGAGAADEGKAMEVESSA